MKLLWITRGVNTHHTTLLHALRSRGIDVVACYFHGAYSAYRRNMGWRDRELESWEHYATTWREIRRAVPDFAERTMLVAGYSDWMNWRTILWCLMHRGKWFAMTEGTSGSWKSRPVFRLFCYLVNRFAIAAFPLGSRATQQYCTFGVRSSKVIPFCYATLPPLSTSTSTSSPTFIYAGEFCRRKAVDIIAAAWKRLHADFPHARLIMAGGGGDVPLDDFLKSDGVEYVGAVRQEAIYDVICRGHVMLLPSRYDPWGAALVEGAMAGLAMIGSDQTVAAVDLIKDGENGYLVHAGDVDSLCTAMCRYASNPSLAHIHGTAARLAAQSTSGDVLAERMIGAL